ncbi:MAG: hypothetical protein ACJ79E_18195 [Anaeromyxobacteraceae bacterium]
MHLVALTLAVALTAAAPHDPAPLRWQELIEPAPGGRATISRKLCALDGRRVRIVGFMAQLEDAPRGAFYLASRPVTGDESGGGTADLPPDAIRVTVRALASAEVPHLAGAIEVIGVLQLGPEVDDEGRVSRIRIVLDAPGPAAP